MTDNQTLPINNPAKRLFEILTRASTFPVQDPIIRVLSLAMEVEDNPDNFIENSSKVFGLIDIIEENIKNKFPRRKQQIYIFCLNDMRTKLIPTINNGLGKVSWEGASGLNDPKWITRNSFELCVHDFEEYGVSIDKNSLNDLIKDVESLMKDVDESDLNDNFKKCVIFELRKIKDILEKYYYYGAEAVKKEINSAFVEIIQVKNEDEKQIEEEKKILIKIIEYLSKWLKLINPLLNTIVVTDKLGLGQLISNITKYHLPPGN